MIIWASVGFNTSSISPCLLSRSSNCLRLMLLSNRRRVKEPLLERFCEVSPTAKSVPVFSYYRSLSVMKASIFGVSGEPRDGSFSACRVLFKEI
jgi:hypothetical protein